MYSVKFSALETRLWAESPASPCSHRLPFSWASCPCNAVHSGPGLTEVQKVLGKAEQPHSLRTSPSYTGLGKGWAFLCVVVSVTWCR